MLNKEVINAKNAPAALGPYSHGVKVGEFIFTAGQIGLIPETSKLAEGIEAQTRQALNNLKAILESVGSDMSKAVKVTVFVTDLNNFAAVNEVYKEFFTTEFPGRSCVEVNALPGNALVEIEMIALS